MDNGLGSFWEKIGVFCLTKCKLELECVSRVDFNGKHLCLNQICQMANVTSWSFVSFKFLWWKRTTEKVKGKWKSRMECPVHRWVVVIENTSLKHVFHYSALLYLCHLVLVNTKCFQTLSFPHELWYQGDKFFLLSWLVTNKSVHIYLSNYFKKRKFFWQVLKNTDTRFRRRDQEIFFFEL